MSRSSGFNLLPPCGKAAGLIASFIRGTRRALLGLGRAAIISLAACETFAAASESIPADLTLDQLEKKRDEIREELSQLANFNLNGSVGTICFRSMPQEHAEVLQWVQIDLDRTYEIDVIALVPAIWRDNENGYRDDGFPRRFRILAGIGDEHSGTVIAEFSVSESILPRVAPLLIPAAGVSARWIRLEADQLGPRFHDGKFILQFAEMLVFSGPENVALHQTVTASSSQRTGIGAYAPEFLVDGFLPYLMDAAQGPKSNPYLSNFGIGPEPTLTIDLLTPEKITSIRLHTIEQGDTVPHALQPDFAVPSHLRIEGANVADFSDALLLWDFRHDNLFEIGPITARRVDAGPFRFVRLRAVAPYHYEAMNNDGTLISGTRLGFAEIELYHGDVNVARGKPVTSSYENWKHDPDRPLSRLTDGHNIFGEILPVRTWIEQLARRHDLEHQLPILEQAIQERYEAQKQTLRLWVGIATGLGALTVIIFLTDRVLRQRAIYATKERIAADLHDELGANLHAIALLGDIALEARDSPEKSAKNIERIRALVRRTSKAVKYSTNMLETPGLYQNLPAEMNQISQRLMSDFDHVLELEGEQHLHRVRPRKRIDLFLFYKEALINVLRHSRATVVRSSLTLGESQLELTVTDNGQGLPADSPFPAPPSLKRRAKLLGGDLSVVPGRHGGTSIILNMKLNKT